MGEPMDKLTYEEAYENVKSEITKALIRSPKIINEYLKTLRKLSINQNSLN